MAAAYVLSERDYLTLKRDHYLLQRELTNLKQTVARGGRRNGKPGRIGPAQIRFRNDNAGTVPAYGVLRITGASTGANTTGGFVTIDQPNTTLQRLYLVNGVAPVATGGFGFASYLTAASLNLDRQFVLYDSGTPAYAEGWGPKASQWSLTKNNWGFTIIGGNDTTKLKTLAVQHVVNHLLGKTDASHAKGASGTINLYTGTLGSETQVTSMTVTAWNRFAAVSSGKWVHCSWVNGGWDLSAAEC